MDRPGLLDRAIAPLHWLERARGWRRRGLACVYLLVATVAGLLGWRELSLWRLPDAPEPFDLAKLGRVAIPDADNAMVAYRAAFAEVGEPDFQGYDPTARKAWETTDWATADPEVRRWAEDHRARLAAWLPATDRPDSLLIQPEDQRIETLLGPAQSLRPFVRLALLEGSRLEGLGDRDGAWRHFRAALRASRHAGRHGGSIQRLIGYALLRQSRPRVEAWAEDPKATPDQLRRAIADVEDCVAMTSPVSEMIRAEYFASRQILAHPETWGDLSDDGPEGTTLWYNHLGGGREARRFLRREPERTARVLRLVVAGYLAQCDRPRAARPRPAPSKFLIYDHDARTPPAVRSITPGELNAWAESSSGVGLWNFTAQFQAIVETEPGTLDRIRLRMAERAFLIERGGPPKTHGDLLGPYLKVLPDGIEPEDPVIPPAS